jgi:CheY-like chemotaxis protein
MPVMNGAEVAAEAVRSRPHLPVLFTTGYADIGVLQSSMQLGYRTLNKPFSAADLELVRSRSNVAPMAPIRPT